MIDYKPNAQMRNYIEKQNYNIQVSSSQIQYTNAVKYTPQGNHIGHYESSNIGSRMLPVSPKLQLN